MSIHAVTFKTTRPAPRPPVPTLPGFQSPTPIPPKKPANLPYVPTRRQARALRRIAQVFSPRPLSLLADVLEYIPDGFGGGAPAGAPAPVTVINPALTPVGTYEYNFAKPWQVVTTHGSWATTGVNETASSLLTLLAGPSSDLNWNTERRQTGWLHPEPSPQCNPGEYYYFDYWVHRKVTGIIPRPYNARKVQVWRNNTGVTINPKIWIYPEVWVWPLPGTKPRHRRNPVRYRVLPNVAVPKFQPYPKPNANPGLNIKGRPPKGYTEIKVRMSRWQAMIWYAVNNVMDAHEAATMFYQASDGPGGAEFAEMMEYLFIDGGWTTIDWVELAQLLAWNEVEDWAYGKLGELSKHASRDLNRPVGITVGWAM